MLAAWWIVLGLFHAQVDPVRRAEMVEAIAAAQAAVQQHAATPQSQEERRRFEEKFNRLVSAMEDFQREYNASRGQVWPQREAEALKKAIKDLPLR
ncbi:MAG TPA: hypothetical protein VKT49_23475 [Bryobacteraceae bacterium]|nr:hypothetical protein [Bryobacteraceae bacterium]